MLKRYLFFFDSFLFSIFAKNLVMAKSSLDHFKMEETRVYGESYVTFSREDPHYIEFLRIYMRNPDVRYLLYNAIYRNEPYYDHEIRKFISSIFCVRIDSILVLDIRAIFKQVDEDLRRFSERITDADFG